MEMRQIISLVEQPDRSARNMPQKPFDQITKADLLHAFFVVADLHDVLENTWYQIDFGNDEHGNLIEIDLPRDPSQLTQQQVDAIVAEIIDGPYRFDRAHKEVGALAALDQIPISRRLNRLSDLSKPLGVHWSYANASYLNTADYGPHTAHAMIDNGSVDWTTTLARALIWWDEEKEITPMQGAKLILSRIDFGPGTEVTA